MNETQLFFDDNEKQPCCKSMMLKELANLYNVSPVVLRKWLRPIRDHIKRTGRYFTPKQVKMIFDYLGEP